MATVTRENIGLLNDKLTVTVAKDDYLPSFEKSIKDYSKRANIPGFRKGMVPVSMVKKMYGSSVFADEVLKSVEKGLQDYMTSEKLEIFAQPLPLKEIEPSSLDMNQPSEYAFAFEVGLKPEFALPDFANLPLTKYNVEITDTMVDDQIKQYLKNYGKRVTKEEVSSDDEDLSLEFSEPDSDATASENNPPKKGSLQLKELLPAAQELFKGKKVDEQITSQLSQLLEGEKLTAVLKELDLSDADVEKSLQIKIAGISLQEDAVFGEELYKVAFPGKEIADEQAFRQEVKDQVAKQWDQQSVNQLQDQIYHALIDTPIAFPDEFLKKWMLTQGKEERTTEEVEKEFPQFTSSLKWNLITDKIITDNALEVQAADLRKAAADQLLGYMGGAIDITQPWINEYLDRMMQDKKYVQDLHQRVMVDKVFDWTMTQVRPTEASISEEAFTKMVSEHKH